MSVAMLRVSLCSSKLCVFCLSLQVIHVIFQASSMVHLLDSSSVNIIIHPHTHTTPCLSGDYRVEEVGVPEVGEGELLVKVLAVGICAGDAKCFAGAPYYWGK